jgi:hypothetical protein
MLDGKLLEIGHGRGVLAGLAGCCGCVHDGRPAVVVRCSPSPAESASSNDRSIILIGMAWGGNMIWIKEAAAPGDQPTSASASGA